MAWDRAPRTDPVGGHNGFMAARPEVPEEMGAAHRRRPDRPARVRPQESAWVGVRWRVGSNTVAHVFQGKDGLFRITFRAEPDEVMAFEHLGDPYFRSGWGQNVVGLLLDDGTDWTELAELLTDSFCLQAPARLAEQVSRPPAPDRARDSSPPPPPGREVPGWRDGVRAAGCAAPDRRGRRARRPAPRSGGADELVAGSGPPSATAYGVGTTSRSTTSPSGETCSSSLVNGEATQTESSGATAMPSGITSSSASTRRSDSSPRRRREGGQPAGRRAGLGDHEGPAAGEGVDAVGEHHRARRPSHRRPSAGTSASVAGWRRAGGALASP